MSGPGQDHIGYTISRTRVTRSAARLVRLAATKDGMITTSLQLPHIPPQKRDEGEAVRAETEIKVDASQAWYLAMLRAWFDASCPALDTTSIKPQRAQRGN